MVYSIEPGTELVILNTLLSPKINLFYSTLLKPVNLHPTFRGDSLSLITHKSLNFTIEIPVLGIQIRIEKIKNLKVRV